MAERVLAYLRDTDISEEAAESASNLSAFSPKGRSSVLSTSTTTSMHATIPPHITTECWPRHRHPASAVQSRSATTGSSAVRRAPTLHGAGFPPKTPFFSPTAHGQGRFEVGTVRSVRAGGLKGLQHCKCHECMLIARC